MKRMVLIVFIVAVSGLLAACSSAESPSVPASVPVTEITLTATDIAYDTNRLEVTAGQPVRVTLQNSGALGHDFSIMEMPHTGEVMAEEAEHGMDGHDMSGMDVDPEIHVASPVGESLSVEFTPAKAGEYEFFCTEAGHKEAGMVGTLVVTEP